MNADALYLAQCFLLAKPERRIWATGESVLDDILANYAEERAELMRNPTTAWAQVRIASIDEAVAAIKGAA